MPTLDLVSGAENLFAEPYYQISQSTKRIKVVYGGAGSAKSYSVHQHELIELMEGKHHTLVLRKWAVDNALSTFELFKSIIHDWGIESWFKFNNSPSDRRITYKPHGNSFIFKGCDDVDKLKSIAGIKRCLIEEASEISLEDFNQISTRFRGMDGVQITLVLNPISEYHWIKEQIVDSPEYDGSGKMVKGAYHEFADVFRFTYHANKFLTAADIAFYENFRNVSESYYKVYVLAEWGVENKNNKFAYNFSKSRHVAPVVYDDKKGVWFTFDFNVNPMTCTVCQVDIPTRNIKTVETVQLENSDTFKMCAWLKANYPNPYMFVTGDATGSNRNSASRDNVTNWQIIQQELGLHITQVKVPTVNPAVEDNQVLLNYVLSEVSGWSVTIDPVKCKPLIKDLEYVEMDAQKNIIKDRSSTNKFADNLDNFRYLVNIVAADDLRKRVKR